MKPTVHTRRPQLAGFSLVEVLIVVAVVGVMAAIAVPQVNRMMEQAQEAKEKSNAQRVCVVAGAAVAAGVVFTDLDGALAVLMDGTGAVGVAGVWAGTRYQVTSLSAAEVEGVKRHVRFEGGQVVMDP